MARIPSIAVVGSGSWAERHMATIVAEEGMTFAGIVSQSLSEEPRTLLAEVGSPKVWPNLDALLESGAERDGVALVVEPARIAELSYRWSTPDYRFRKNRCRSAVGDNRSDNALRAGIVHFS